MLNSVDIAVLVLYLIVVIGMGLWFARHSSNSDGFMTAGGTLPGWAVGLSIFGTYLSSNTFLGVPGAVYGGNWNALAFSFSLPIAAWIAVKYFVPFYRQHDSISAYEHLEQRFGAWARTYGVVCYLLTQLFRMGAILYGVSLAMAALTGWSQLSIIVVSGVLVTLYTTLGGIEAVIWTDVMQAVVLSVGAVVVLGLLLIDMPGGPAKSVEVAANAGKFSLGSFAFDFTMATFWVTLLYGLFENLKNFGIDQSFVQRYHTSVSTKQAARSVWVGALLYVPVSMVFFMIGSSVYSYYQANPNMQQEVRMQVAEQQLASQAEPGLQPAGSLPPGSLPPGSQLTGSQQTGADYQALAEQAAQLSDADIGDKVLPHFIVNRLPVGVTGLLIAAIFAAAMSSIDTSLNSSATVMLVDIYKRHLRPQASEREAMAVLYAGTVVMGVVGIGVAVAMIGVESVLTAWWTLSGIFAGGLLGLFLLGMICRHARKPAAVCGAVAGLAAILWMTMPQLEKLGMLETIGIHSIPAALKTPLHAHMTIVVGTLTIFFVGLVVSKVDNGPHSTSGKIVS